MSPALGALILLAVVFLGGVAVWFFAFRDPGEAVDHRGKPIAPRREMKGSFDDGNYKQSCVDELQRELAERWPAQTVRVSYAGNTIRIENRHCGVDLARELGQHLQVRAGDFRVVECRSDDGEHFATFDRVTLETKHNWR